MRIEPAAAIGVGWYLPVPFLAERWGAGWAAGLVLAAVLVGVSQGERLGRRPVVGCVLGAGGFAVLGLVDALPVVLVAAVAVGAGGALTGAGESRTGVLVGPVVGLALVTVDFTLACLVAAGAWAVLGVLRVSAVDEPGGMAPWALFPVLPLAAQHPAGAVAAALLFAGFGVVTVCVRARLAVWACARWAPDRRRVVGIAVLGGAFVPPALTSATGAQPVPAAVGLLLCAALLALGTTLVPVGPVVAAGVVLAAGVLVGLGVAVLPWLVLAAAGAGCAWWLDRPGVRPPVPAACAACPRTCQP